ncbi:hypothetical protein ACFYOT_38905 [Saccharothrix saharensis]|uniref:hypothetical protein n=1 Tax=Saccharothrix saharensis TaxID=571190 RepID=UPI00368384D8
MLIVQHGTLTDWGLWTVIVTASLLAALGGLLLSGRLASVASAQGNGYIFTVFAAAVIGGVPAQSRPRTEQHSRARETG